MAICSPSWGAKSQTRYESKKEANTLVNELIGNEADVILIVFVGRDFIVPLGILDILP